LPAPQRAEQLHPGDRPIPRRGGTLSEPFEILDEAACGLARTREDGTFLRVNRTFCDWIGRPAPELVGLRRFQDLLTVGGRIFHQTHWAPLLRMQGSISEVKLEIVHREGTKLPIVVNAVRYEKGGEAYHELAAFVARDRDKYERELVASRKRLEELVVEATRLKEEAKDRALFAEQMIGIVSHDLRNPLSSIMAGATLLARGQLTEGQQRTVTRIARSADRANLLIADLLDFTQARLGRGLGVSIGPLDLHRTVAEALDELGSIHPDAHFAHRRIGEGSCLGDAHRIAQLLGNLVSNAVVYGAAAAPITVTSEIAEASVSVAVHNEGPSIAEEVQATIFQPMTRGSHAGGSGRSIGLGLYIVREIARAHGGDARVRSVEGEGTTFTATFLRTQDDASEL
jgi:sigma-B regulation protein RsbU (phosphoserine phosphatase)